MEGSEKIGSVNLAKLTLSEEVNIGHMEQQEQLSKSQISISHIVIVGLQ